jgi:hypothetical protein
MCELAKIVSGPRPAYREACEAPQLAAVIDREEIAVLFSDAERVVAVREVEGDEVVARAGHVA